MTSTVLVGPGSAAPTRPEPAPPSVVGLAPVTVRQQVDEPEALPRRKGSVPLRRTETFRSGAIGGSTRSGASGASTLSLAPDGAASATAAATGKVALRALVVAVDESDFGLPTWKSTLDRVGAAYDVLLTRDSALTAETLVRPDGVGRYGAVLLTTSSLLYAENGGYVSGLTADEWNLLWTYERDYAVRQAVLYGSHGTWPEDYCLSGVSEGAVGATPVPTALTAAGAKVFDYLKPSAQVPVVESYVYRTAVRSDCSATPVLSAGNDTVGVLSPSADGRERLMLTFTSNQYLLQSDLLAYGLFRWASRGLFLGEQRHYLHVDVDDWFNSADHYYPDGHVESDPGYQMSGHDAYNVSLRQQALRQKYPLAGGVTLGMAYNGGDANLNAGNRCYPNGGINKLTPTTRCLANQFRWINHTLTHPELNFTDYATSRAEIADNLAVASRLGLPVDGSVLKTGEYSGLGVYNPDPDNDTDPPTDFGLTASNPELLRAARDLGVKYLHGNMSFPSHRPACFNCGTTHPLEPSVTVVPDWPTNVAYHCTTPAEETAFYNSFYGPNGKFPFWPTNLTYNQVVSAETDVALSHLSSGSLYSHTFHIANLRDYGSGRTLLTDWLDSLLGKYSAYYAVPVLSLDWPALAQRAAGRNGHFAQLAGGVDGVFDRTAGTVTLSSPTAGTLTVSGARTAAATTYGSEVSTPVTLTAGQPVTVTASPLP
ncbi:Agd3-related carbohydrate-binding protein [Micromonospora purpureochromogenes]|uniref:Agd3-related carbohydrate-binding protein n=1 Tax=Micromonospora purpureochromogenes TaxID=47872 RepID=UPI0015CE6B79|nr:hypothetical protein [Micromonospora purpureochromogenes]